MDNTREWTPENDPEEMNLVELWTRRDPTRWIAGLLAGAFAGLVAMGCAMLISVILGFDAWFPMKLFGAILLGPRATIYGFNLGPIIAGLLLFEAIAAFFGFVYAHFVATNVLRYLLAMGVVWALFSWVFIWDLFLQSFKVIYHAGLSPGAAFPICLAYGISLTSVAFFDRALRGNRAR